MREPCHQRWTTGLDYRHALANDCYKYMIDLVTNGVVITDAIKFAQQKKQELNQINSNTNKASSGEDEAKKGTKEKEEETLASGTLDDNVVSQNTRHQVF